MRFLVALVNRRGRLEIAGARVYKLLRPRHEPYTESMTTRLALLACCGLLPCLSALAGTVAAAAAPKKWYQPDYLALQHAGNIGFLAVGLGKDFRDEKLQTSLFYGVVPKAVGGVNIYTLTAKLSIIVGEIQLRNKVTLVPFYIGTGLSYAFGDQYQTKSDNPWPRDYYPNAAYYVTPYIGMHARRPIRGGHEAGLYFELGSYYIYLEREFRNQAYLDVGDMLNVALGVTVSLP